MQQPEPGWGDQVAAVIPALDEGPNLPGLLADLAREGVRRVVVVDNGSTDDTAQAARAGGAQVVREPRRGYGSACQAGLGWLAASGAPPGVVLFLDADRSDDPGAVARVVGPVVAGEADLVVGVRQGRGDASARQRLGTRAIALGAGLLYGVRLADLGPFRAIDWSTLAALRMDDPDWGWTLQMQLRAHRLGARVMEVPVTRRPRAEGRSKISGRAWTSLAVGLRMAETLVRERRWRPAGSGG
jgi:glycosyltransferase involved in cell wall biosynthesis